MADLNSLEASDAVKIVGSDSSGVETNAVNSTDGGALYTNLRDEDGSELVGQRLMADSIPVALASDQIVTVDFIPDLKSNNRLKVETINLGGPIVQVSSDDQSIGYLEAKVVGTSGKIVVSTLNPGGDEDLQINIGADVFDKVVNTTDNITEGATKLFFTTERAQDAVSAALTDTASVDFTYNDGANTITASVLPAGVDHNSLQNYVANRHIDHSAVNITAGTGLSGGGDITTSRTLNIANTTVAAGTYGSASIIPVLTVNAQGQLTGVTNTPVNITIPNQLVSSNATISTTSTTFSTMSGVTITPIAGTYVVLASAGIRTVTDGAGEIRIEYGGAEQSNSLRQIDLDVTGTLGANGDVRTSMTTQAIITANGSTAINFQYRSVTNTITAFNRSMILIKVG